MPEPRPDPDWPVVRQTVLIALIAGVGITALKFAVFAHTNSATVLSDALESIINVVAAVEMLYTLRHANRPPDRTHPYGHGKAEFMAVAFEGAMILMAGILIGYEAIARLIDPPALHNFDRGALMLLGVGAFALLLALFVLRRGRRSGSRVLLADGKHLLTDVGTTIGAIGGLALVHWTGLAWLDPILALIFAVGIVYVSWGLLSQSVNGLMDRTDPDDDRAVREVLEDELNQGSIRGFHKVRTRRNGSFCWIDMHLHVDPTMNVTDAHKLASRIEHRIEQEFIQANATAHVEPAAGGANRLSEERGSEDRGA